MKLFSQQVHAVDLDFGENGEVRYELIRGHGELFKVCRKTGEISLKQSLEGHKKNFQLGIAAYDGGWIMFSQLETLEKAVPLFGCSLCTVYIYFGFNVFSLDLWEFCLSLCSLCDRSFSI